MNKAEQFAQWEEKLSAYQYALNLHWLDGNNEPPEEGRAYSQKMASILHGERFALENDPEIHTLLEELKDDPDPLLRRKAQLYLEKTDRMKGVDKDEYVAYQKILADSIQAWLKYRTAGDWKSYAPYLKDLVEAYSRMFEKRERTGTIYDLMLEDHEKGWNTKRYDEFFQEVKEHCVPLLKKIAEAKQPDVSFLHQYYPAEKQRQYMPEVLKYLGFTEKWGKMYESAHPVTSCVSQGDIRFSTKYRENDVSAAILSSVHEIGHAWYGHDTDPLYDGTVIARSICAGMHESQSRLLENHIGKSLVFWQMHLPGLQKVFPEELKGVSAEQFYRAVCAVKPGLIRTLADEVTYPLHIMIRYEIEKMMFSGKADILRLDEVWNQMVHDLLGLDVPDASQGILQDMHWPYAYFGYFPTYALGSAFAAQFYAALEKEVPVEKLFAEGKPEAVFRWLREHIHTYAGYLDPDEVMRSATGKDFDIHCWTDYIERKYTQLYSL